MSKAPRRKIVGTERIGDWGNYQYRHTLECGHVDVRKRMAVGRINCHDCVLAASKDDEMKALATAPQRQVLMDVSDYFTLSSEDDNAVEVEASELRAALAKRLGVSGENIDVVLTDDAGKLVLDYALVYLSAKEAKRLATNG